MKLAYLAVVAVLVGIGLFSFYSESTSLNTERPAWGPVQSGTVQQIIHEANGHVVYGLDQGRTVTVLQDCGLTPGSTILYKVRTAYSSENMISVLSPPDCTAILNAT